MIRPIAILDAAKNKRVLLWTWSCVLHNKHLYYVADNEYLLKSKLQFKKNHNQSQLSAMPADFAHFIYNVKYWPHHSNYGEHMSRFSSIQQLGHWPATLSVLVSATTWRENGKNVPFSLVPIISPHLWLSHSGSSSILFLGQCLQMCLPDKKAIHWAKIIQMTFCLTPSQSRYYHDYTYHSDHLGLECQKIKKF